MRVAPEDVERRAFNTKYGQVEFMAIPIGLCNAPATFQTLMNRISYVCIDIFLVVYMDDLLVFSENQEDHYDNLKTVLSRLAEHQLFVSESKCEFIKSEIEFLCLTVRSEGIRIGDDRISTVKTWPTWS